MGTSSVNFTDTQQLIDRIPSPIFMKNRSHRVLDQLAQLASSQSQGYLF